MNWGVKIAIFYTSFVLIVLASVFFAMNQKFDLVTENYYDKEIKYQEQIDKQQRTNSLKEKTEIQLMSDIVKIKFPNLPDKNNPKNSIILYRPSDVSKDIKLTIIPDSLKYQVIPIRELTKGLWKIKLNWVSDGTEYYHESIINIQ